MTAARVTPGAISLSNSSHFALMPYSNDDKAGGVAARPRQALDEAGADRIGDDQRTRSARCGSPVATAPRRAASGQDDVRRERDQFRRIFANALGIACAPADVDLHVAAVGPAQLLQPLQERREAGLSFRIVRGQLMSTPMRRIRSPCCARAASGHAAAAPPSSVMNSRRFILALIRSPRRRGRFPRSIAFIKWIARKRNVGRRLPSPAEANGSRQIRGSR